MAHHSSNFNDEVISKMFGEQHYLPREDNEEELSKRLADKIDKLGATGEFPEGKLTPHDEGEIRFAVGEKDGKIIIDFGKPVVWFGATKEQAKDLGQLLIQKASGANHTEAEIEWWNKSIELCSQIVTNMYVRGDFSFATSKQIKEEFEKFKNTPTYHAH